MATFACVHTPPFKLDTTAIYAEVSILQLQEVHARCHPSARLAEVPASAAAPDAASVPPATR